MQQVTQLGAAGRSALAELWAAIDTRIEAGARAVHIFETLLLRWHAGFHRPVRPLLTGHMHESCMPCIPLDLAKLELDHTELVLEHVG